MDGFDYVNQHSVMHNKLEHLGVKMTKTAQMTQFVEHIIDPDFETVHQLLESYLLEIEQGYHVLKIIDFTDIMESQQRGLNCHTEKDMEIELYLVLMKEKILKHENSKPSRGGQQKKKLKKTWAMKIWHTGSRASASQSKEGQLLIKSHDKGFESDTDFLNDVKKVQACKIVDANCHEEIKSDNTLLYSTTIDYGTEWTVIGGLA
eukprot:7419711-Ditylum_brightwellii.AAC.1